MTTYIETEKQIEKEQGMDVEALYKGQPPFMRFPGGFGYLGVVLINRKTDRVQCHMCGAWLAQITDSHTRLHKLSIWEYKQKIGVFKKTPLINRKTQSLLKAQGKKNQIALAARMVKDPSIEARRIESIRKAQKASLKGHGKPSRIMQRRNHFGICEEQLKYRLDKFVQENGRVPSSAEFTSDDAMKRRFGSWNKALEHFGYPTKERVSRNSLKGIWRRTLIFLGFRPERMRERS